MLKIKANGYYLDLPDDIQISFIIENPLMLTDRIPVPYSLTFDLPPTSTNLKALKYPNRVTSKNGFGEYECDIFFGPINLMPGFLVVTSTDKSIKCNFRGVRFEDKIKRKLFEIEMEEVSFGTGHIKFPEFGVPGSIGTNYKQTNEQAILGNKNFVSAPVRTAVDLTDLDRFGGWRMGLYTYLNFYNAREHSYMFNTSHTPIYPMPYLKNVLQDIFGELLTDNMFNEGELADLVMVTYFPSTNTTMLLDTIFPAIQPRYDSEGRPRRVNASDLTAAEKAEAKFRINSFLPASPANDFLKNLLKIFCATLYPYRGKYKIVKNTTIINDITVENWSCKIIGTPMISQNVMQTYVYGYESNSNVDPGTGAVELQTIEELVEESTLSEIEGGQDFKILTTGQIFTKELLDGETTYTLLNSGLGGSTSDSTEVFDMTSAIEALPMNINKYWWEWRGNLEGELSKLYWYVPEINEVINSSSSGDSGRPTRGSVNRRAANGVLRGEKVYIMFYRGIVNTFSAPDKYPYITPYNYDHFGNKIGDLSLSWDAPDGLIKNYHMPFKKWVEMKKQRLRASFKLEPLDIKNLDLMKKKHINGRLFFIEKVSLTVRKFKIDPALIDFLEAPRRFPEEGDPLLFTVEKTQAFRKVCAYNELGSYVDFSKTYTSALGQTHAQYLADNDPDFNSEGQAYANANGTCTLGIRVTVSFVKAPFTYTWAVNISLSQPTEVNVAVGVSWKDQNGTTSSLTVALAAGTSTKSVLTQWGSKAQPYDVRLVTIPSRSKGLSFIY